MMLSLDTAYRSFGGEVEASSPPRYAAFPIPPSQLWAIALRFIGRYDKRQGHGVLSSTLLLQHDLN
jgi:hypothetical protein